MSLEKQLDCLMQEINLLLVDVFDAAPHVNQDILEQKKYEAAQLGMKIAVQQITQCDH